VKVPSENIDGVEHTFLATMHSIRTGYEKNLATFYLMNTTPNRLGWGVTDQALEEALPTLLGKTIGCGPDYQIDDHYPDPMEVGTWVSFNKPNGYALATAEITDDVVLGKLKRGEWGPVSVVIDAYKINSQKGKEALESFKFKTVDFVNTPAFPQAGLINFASLPGETIVNPIELCASFYESQSNGQAPGSLGVSQNPEELTKMQKEIDKLKQEMKTLTASYTEIKKEYDELKAGLDKPAEEPTDIEEDPKYKALEAKHKETEDKVKVMEDERHAERVAAALDGRTKAGLVKDQKAEAERLGKLDDMTLSILTLDAGAIAEKLEKTAPTGPKLKYNESAEDANPLKAAVDAKRAAMFGSRSYTAAKESRQ